MISIDKYDESFMNILKGNFENVPELDSTLTRVFLSSTFTGI